MIGDAPRRACLAGGRALSARLRPISPQPPGGFIPPVNQPCQLNPATEPLILRHLPPARHSVQIIQGPQHDRKPRGFRALSKTLLEATGSRVE